MTMTNVPSGSWTPTVSVDEMAEWIGSMRTCVLLTHIKPDGDALGSTLALAATIRKLRGE